MTVADSLDSLIFEELGTNERSLLDRVHQLDGGCALLHLLDARPTTFFTVEDMAFHLNQSHEIVESNLRTLAEWGLIRRIEGAGMVFWGLDSQQSERVHRLYAWQSRWHARLERLEAVLLGKTAT